jgi:hypothetical protein
MKGFSLKWKSFLIGFVVGILTIIVASLAYTNTSFVIEILSSLYTIYTAIGASAIVAIIIFYFNFFRKPKPNLVLEDAQFIAKGFDHTSICYQLKVFVMNKGKKICPNLDDVTIIIKDVKGNNPSLVKISKDLGDKRIFTLEKEQMRNVRWCWVDKNDIIKPDLEELRKDDPYYLVYPCENSSPNLTKQGKYSSFAYSEYLLNLKDEEYIVNIKLKGVDKEGIVVGAKEKFKIKPPFATCFTTTKDAEVDALKTANNLLQSVLSEKEHMIQKLNSNNKSKDEELVRKDTTLNKKYEDINQLKVRITDLKRDNNQKTQENKRLRKQQQELMDKIEWYKKKIDLLENPSKTKHRVK